MTVLRVCYKHGVRFDEAYYVGTHGALVESVFGPHGLERVEIMKVTGTPDGAPPPYQNIFSAYFASPASLQMAMQDPRTPEVMGDIRNFYDGMPDVIIGEVLAG